MGEQMTQSDGKKTAGAIEPPILESRTDKIKNCKDNKKLFFI
jgi:hypothetical protein